MYAISDFREILKRFAETPTTATLYRMEFPGDAPVATGAYLMFEPRHMDIHGITTGLPHNIRLEPERVLISSRDAPDDWEILENDDTGILRVFTMLDPRRLSWQLQDVSIRPLGTGNELVTGRVDLHTWEPRLSSQFLQWLDEQERSATVRTVWLEFHNERLTKLVMNDLPPRSADIITAIFEYPVVASNHNGT